MAKTITTEVAVSHKDRADQIGATQTTKALHISGADQNDGAPRKAL